MEITLDKQTDKDTTTYWVDYGPRNVGYLSPDIHGGDWSLCFVGSFTIDQQIDILTKLREHLKLNPIE